MTDNPINPLIDRERIRGASRMIPEGTEAAKVSADQIRAVAADVEGFCRANKISRKAVAVSAGYSPGVVSEFLAGKYNGDNAKVAIDLENWLVSEEQRRSRPRTTQFVWSSVAMTIKSAASYAIEREFEDVAAVIEAIGEPVFLLGHSYGAICTLEASLLTDKVRRLILYEPPIPTGLPLYPPAVPDRIQALVDAGDPEAGLEMLLREIVRMQDSELQRYRALPIWKVRVQLAPTIPRELVVDRGYRFQPERFASFAIPTLLLVGGDSPPAFRQATDAIAAALADVRVAVMAGQRHVAMDSAPELFLAEVGKFLSAP